MKKFSKLTSLVLAALMILSAFVVGVHGETGETPVYAQVTDKDFAGKVTAIELTLPALTASDSLDYIPAVVLEKTDTVGTHKSLELLLVSLKDRTLGVKLGGELLTLCDKDGNAIALSSGDKIAAVYDDINGDVRAFVNGGLTYVKLDGKVTLAADLGVGVDFCEMGKARMQTVKLLLGFKENTEAQVSVDDYHLKVSAINDGDTARLIGCQENSLTNGIRMIAGVDSLYYTAIGFEIETYEGGVSKGITEIIGNKVYDSVSANDKTITAESEGYAYLAAGVITEVSRELDENSFLSVRSFAEIEGIKHYDSSAQIIITSDGYYFGEGKELLNYKYNGIDEPPAGWITSSEGGRMGVKNGELLVDATGLSALNYYTEDSFGSNYAVQGDFRFISVDNGDAWASVMLLSDGADSFVHAGFCADGEWFIRAIDGGKSTTCGAGNSGVDFYLGQTYTIEAMCFGNCVALFVDGILVGEAEVPEKFTSGRVGIALGNAVLACDDLSVRRITEKYDGRLVYSEDFDGLTDVPYGWIRMEGTTPSSSRVSINVADGVLVLNDTDKAVRAVVVYEKEFEGDFIFEADLTMTARINSSRYMGIVYGAKDDILIATNLKLEGGRIQSEALEDNVWNKLTPDVYTSKAHALNVAHRFRAVFADGIVTFYIDGVEYHRYELPEEFASGMIGFIISQNTVEVDNVRVFEIKEYESSDSVIGSESEKTYETIGSLVYSESFDGLTAVPEKWGKMSVATSVDSAFSSSVADGALVLNDMTGSMVSVIYDEVFDGNYSFEVDLTMTDRANESRYMGIIFGAQDGSLIAIDMRMSDGRLLAELWDDSASNTWSKKWVSQFASSKLNATPALDKAYTFRADCIDGIARVYVDDVEYLSFALPEGYESGKVGVIFSQSAIKVDNAKVRKVERYELNPVYEADFDGLTSAPAEWAKHESLTGSNSSLTLGANGDKLVLKDETGTRTVVVLDEEINGGDFIYEADITLAEKHASDSWWMGPAFGLSDNGTGMLIDVNVSGKWSLSYYKSGWKEMAGSGGDSTKFVKGTGVDKTLKMRVISIDGVATFLVNGTEYATVTVPDEFRYGKFGFCFRNSTLEIDNVKIYRLNEYYDYDTTYEADFDGRTLVPLEWEKATNTTDKTSTLVMSATGDDMVLKDEMGVRTVVALDRELNGGDFIYEVELTMTETFGKGSWWMGPVFGLQDNGDFVIMDTYPTSGNWYVEQRDYAGGKWNEYIRPSSKEQYIKHYGIGVPMYFRITCIDGVGTATINGNKIATFTVPEEFLTGKVGVGFRNSTVEVGYVRLQLIEKTPEIAASADSLNGKLSLGDNSVMYNNVYSFSFNTNGLTAGQAVTLAHGNSLVKVTDTEIIALNSSTEAYRAPHGLNISGAVEIIVDTDYGKARARIKLADKAFSTELFDFTSTSGEVYAQGASLTDAKLLRSSTDFDNNVWIVGDNIGFDDSAKWTSYLGKGGITLIGSENETAASALLQVKAALTLGVPEYIVWAVGGNDADGSAVNADWQAALDELLALCREKGITPVLATLSGDAHSFKNGVVTSSGYRYIDFASVSGAEAMSKEVLMDFTNIKNEMTGTRIRVATYNVGNYTGVGLKRGAEDTRLAYVELMESVGADLWALQEDEKYTDNENTEESGTVPYDAIYKNVLPNHQGFFTGKYNGKSFLSKLELKDVQQIYYPAPETSYTSSVYHYGHRWFLSGKIEFEGKEITIISLHLDWNCKERRATQIKELVKYAKEQEYCIIMGDFNPEDYVNNVEISKALFYKEELALFGEIGMTWANAGKFGTFDTLVSGDESLCGPWDNILVSSNMEIVYAERVTADWMNDHAIVVAEIAIN